MLLNRRPCLRFLLLSTSYPFVLSQSGATSKIKNASPYDHPYWHLERARIGRSRKVPVELVANGQSVQRVEIDADGTPRPVEFDMVIAQSSWIALRIYPSSHTNPIYISVARQAHTRIEKERRMVSSRCRCLLAAKNAENSKIRDRRSQHRVRPRTLHV